MSNKLVKIERYIYDDGKSYQYTSLPKYVKRDSASLMRDTLQSFESNLLPEERAALNAAADVIEYASWDSEYAEYHAFEAVCRQRFGVFLDNGGEFRPIHYTDAYTVTEFIDYMFTEETRYAAPKMMTYSECQYQLRQMINDGTNIPLGITAEAYQIRWNHNCSKY